jgi:8-oxo-dGTP pyrophosphatase MutT (NUDIX family)
MDEKNNYDEKELNEKSIISESLIFEKSCEVEKENEIKVEKPYEPRICPVGWKPTLQEEFDKAQLPGSHFENSKKSERLYTLASFDSSKFAKLNNNKILGLADNETFNHGFTDYYKGYHGNTSSYNYNGKYKKRILQCNNCGKKGHYYNRCIDPVISIGVIAFKVTGINNLPSIFTDLINYDKTTMMKIKQTKGINLDEIINFSSENKIKVHSDNEIITKICSFNKYLESIKFLMVRRKFTLGFIEFMKGKWHADDKDQLINIFSRMGRKEINSILDNIEEDNWKNIFDNFWIRDGKINFEKKKEDFGRKFIELRDLGNVEIDDDFEENKESEASEKLSDIVTPERQLADSWSVFNLLGSAESPESQLADGELPERQLADGGLPERQLADGGSSERLSLVVKQYNSRSNISDLKKNTNMLSINTWNLEYYCINIGTGNHKPDWGFCKGRREGTETNQETAIRETKEESGNDIVLLENLQELKEDIVKEDGNRLRNIYYLGLLDDTSKADYRPDLYLAHQSEIGEIGFFNFMDALTLIGPNYEEKKHVLTQAYLFITSRLMKYENLQK